MQSTMKKTSEPRRVTAWTNPVPASRPRVTKWGTYYSKTYKDWMRWAEANIPEGGDPPLPGHYDVVLEFIVAKPRTSKLTRPVGDVDNYAKAILDVLTKKGYWPDDADVVCLQASKRFAHEDEEPRTEAFIKGPL
jgi:Holliday junction resolvase RusA-like endonuclease